jgi:hypothetical protein
MRLQLLPDGIGPGGVRGVGLEDGAAGAVEVGVAVLVGDLVGVAGCRVAVVVLVGQVVAESLVAGVPSVRGCLGLPHSAMSAGERLRFNANLGRDFCFAGSEYALQVGGRETRCCRRL